jgi:hypothetical protein
VPCRSRCGSRRGSRLIDDHHQLSHKPYPCSSDVCSHSRPHLDPLDLGDPTGPRGTTTLSAGGTECSQRNLKLSRLPDFGHGGMAEETCVVQLMEHSVRLFQERMMLPVQAKAQRTASSSGCTSKSWNYGYGRDKPVLSAPMIRAIIISSTPASAFILPTTSSNSRCPYSLQEKEVV